MSQSRQTRIRFLSYNIHGCVGRGGREDPAGILNIIREADPDFVALQEVQDHDEADLSFLRGVETLPFAQIIYGQTMQKPLGAYGNLLLSRHPLTSVNRRDISFTNREPRGIIEARSDAYGTPLHILATHLGLKRHERRAHIRELMRLRGNITSEQDGTVRILVGDMNEWFPFSSNIKSLQAGYSRVSTIKTFPARLPLLALDRIFVDGPVQAVRFTRIETKQAKLVSDHLPLLADLQVECYSGL